MQRRSVLLAVLCAILVPAISHADLLSALRSPQVVFDEEMAVPAGGSQLRGFTLPSSRRVKLEVRGLKNVDKGYSVYVIPTEDWEGFKNHFNPRKHRKGEAPPPNTFREIEAFRGLDVRGMTKTAELPAGNWAVVIKNSENLFFGMVVNLKVTADPKD